MLAQAVHAVHEAGILHWDLKPSNVLMTSRGEPKITDFGLAKLLSNDSLLTTANCLLGTPSYMPPEQAGGDSRATFREGDIYSLGAILYELLTGRPPFLGVTILCTLSMIRERDPIPPRNLAAPHSARLGNDLPQVPIEISHRAVSSRGPSWPTISVASWRARRSSPAVPPSSSGSARWGRRNPLVASLAAVSVLTGVVGFTGVVWQWRQAERARQSESLARRDADQRALDASEGARAAQAGQRLFRDRARLSSRAPLGRCACGIYPAIELRPEHVQVWEARGELLYVRLGLWDLAAHDLEQAFRLQRPNFLSAGCGLRFESPSRRSSRLRRNLRGLARTQRAQWRGRHASVLVRTRVLSPVKISMNQDLIDLADELAVCNPTRGRPYSYPSGLDPVAGRPTRTGG